MKGDCGKRAMVAALRWCRFSEEKIAELDLDSISSSDDLRRIAERLGLEFLQQGGVILASNNPVLVSYRDNFAGSTAEWHTVFISDVAPMFRWEVHSAIIGWERLLAETEAK